jgi:RNA polymerase sigma-70 factor (ECF subfamily)
MNGRMSIDDEAELLESARAFDMQALTLIFDQYSLGIFQYANHLLGDEALAEDCVAETFSRLLKALKVGKGPVQYLKAYLYRTAHNWVHDHYRIRFPEALEDEQEIIDDDLLSIEQIMDGKKEQARIRTALKRLTKEQRLVITLRFIEEWEYEEIAEALGKKVNAVKALQHRGLRSLKRILDE